MKAFIIWVRWLLLSKRISVRLPRGCNQSTSEFRCAPKGKSQRATLWKSNKNLNFQVCVRFERSEEDSQMGRTNFKVFTVTLRNIYKRLYILYSFKPYHWFLWPSPIWRLLGCGHFEYGFISSSNIFSRFRHGRHVMLYFVKGDSGAVTIKWQKEQVLTFNNFSL